MTTETYVDIPTGKAVMGAMTRYCDGAADLAELRQARDTLCREIGRALDAGRVGQRKIEDSRDTAADTGAARAGQEVVA